MYIGGVIHCTETGKHSDFQMVVQSRVTVSGKDFFNINANKNKIAKHDWCEIIQLVKTAVVTRKFSGHLH